METRQRGGKREGAGRKKANHTIATEKAREYLIMKIREHMAPIVAAQIDSAKGLSYVGEAGKIYTQPPNTKVGEYLLNQIAGRPNLNIEIQKPLEIVVDLEKKKEIDDAISEYLSTKNQTLLDKHLPIGTGLSHQ